VRRLGLFVVVVAALTVTAQAEAATLSISPRTFSPRRATVDVSAQLTVERQVGVRLATLGGRPIGWIVAPSRRRTLAAGWDGRIRGKIVPDGNYVARLVYRSSVLATAHIRVDTHAPQLLHMRADNGSTPFAGDGPLLTTVSPNGDGFRDHADVTFELDEPATVTMDVTRTVKVPKVVYTLTEHLGPGVHTMTWPTASTLNPRTYLIRFTATDGAGNRGEYGAPNAFVGRHARGVVVRVQGIDSYFTRPSYLPGDLAQISIATDDPTLTVRVFHSGPEQVVTYADNQFAGVEVDPEPATIDWTPWTSRPHTISFHVPDVPSGLYYVQFTGSDGRVGYAPFVVRPTLLGTTSRVLVILPTNTWQAYNFQDVNGDGYGDTWYAGPPNKYMSLSKG
jgi:hypothetical protein